VDAARAIVEDGLGARPTYDAQKVIVERVAVENRDAVANHGLATAPIAFEQD
jgi:hypothetical protein